jgi:tRNA A-37 threonylcarbamoyl transferase component Bud32
MLKREHIVISAEWRPLLMTHGLTTVDGVYRLSKGLPVTRSGSTEVRRVLLGEAARSRVVYIKKYWLTNPNQIASGLTRGMVFGRGKARREYENLERLRRWEVDAPFPVAYGEERVCGCLVRSFLMSEEVTDPVPLSQWIRDMLRRLDDQATVRAWRRTLLTRLADAVGRLHEHGFVHHDLFWRNIILSGGGLETFSLIDAHKGRSWRDGEEPEARARDLASLDAAAPFYFSKSERMRFFMRYRRVSRLRPEDKELIRRVLALAAPMRARQRERVERE